MWRLVVAQLRRRAGRAAILAVGVLVASGGVAVMTASATTSQLREVGTVRANARASYDILVRPTGTRTALERTEGLVRGDFLSGIFGGITVAQWHQVLRLPGVEVAAPVEVLGYALPTIRVPIIITPYVPGSGQALFRVQSDWSTDSNLTNIKGQADYVYLTSAPLAYTGGSTTDPAAFQPVETLPSGRTLRICPQQGDVRFEGGMDLSCVNYTGSSSAGDQYGWPELWGFPFLIAAVDPTQEARLDGLDRAVTSGRYLRATDTSLSGSMPVLVSGKPDFQLNEHVTVERLPSSAAEQVAGGAGANTLDADRGQVLFTKTVTADDAYRYMLQQLLHPAAQLVNGLGSYWTGSPVRFDQHGARELAPIAVNNPLQTWSSNVYSGGGSAVLPADGLDTAYQHLHEHVAVPTESNSNGIVPLHAVGTFDAGRVEQTANLARLPLGLFQNPAVTGADPATVRALGGRPLVPDGDIAGYLQQTPLMLTTLAGANAMFGGVWQTSGDATAPISSIRVRVAGVTGVDTVSQARVRLVAAEIAQTTGLQVDVTAGASETPITIHLPAGRYGRPALELTQVWVKLGVALALVRALDDKTLALAALSLLVCALFVFDATAAAVRSRRSELGILACLGWRRHQLFGVVLGELAVVGAVAGAVAAAAALGTARLLHLDLPAWHALLTVPGAAVLAVLGGAGAAWGAGRVSPVEAARPTVRNGVVTIHPRSVAGLAAANLLRVPARTVLAMLSLVIGVGTLALLLAIQLAFHGVAVGTLLGNAVALQVHGQDVAAVAMVVTMSALSVADVLYLSTRERTKEMAALVATGWRTVDLGRLVLAEALGLGLVASVLGAVLGLAASALLVGAVPGPAITGAVAAGGAGLLVAAVACVLPLRVIHTLPVARLLSGE